MSSIATLLIPAIVPDRWEQLSWQATVFAALVAAVIALAQAGWALRLRRRDLRWKQAELAHRMMDEWFDSEPSNNALLMVDEGKGDYSIAGSPVFSITNAQDIKNALAVKGTGGGMSAVNETEKDKFVRKCFDGLFYYLERAQHAIDIGLVVREDLEFPAAYYVRQLGNYRPSIEPYLLFSQYHRALRFLQSFKKGWGPPTAKRGS